MKLEDIARTWPHFVRAGEATQELIIVRLRSCDLCPNKKQLLVSGGIQSGGENKPDSVYYCGTCGCSLWNRTKDEEKSCPISKWRAVE